MKRHFDTKAAAQGGAGVALAAASILGGIIVLLGIWESRITWGIFLILCGISFVLGMKWFGYKTVSEKNKD